MSSPTPHRRLLLQVRDKTIFFSLYRRGNDGTDHPQLSNEPFPLGLDPMREGTISLLVRLQQLLSDALRESQTARERLSGDLNETLYNLVQILGQHLYSVLFPPRVHDNLNRALENLGTDELLRIELEFTGETESLLSSWPWEYLYRPLDANPQTGLFLAQVAQLVLNRKLSMGGFADTFSLSTPQPVTLLLVISKPRGLDPVLSEPVEEVVEQLARAKVIDLTVLKSPEFSFSEDYRPLVDAVGFRAAVKEIQPHIIHFIGHGQLKGGQGQIALVNARGEPDWVDDEQFVQDVAQSAALKLVFLQACESALPDPHTPISGVALKLAHRRIPAVVAMQAKVSNEDANTFATHFYEVLAGGGSVDQAVMEGRKRIQAKLGSQKLAFGIPVLYLRSYERLIEEKAPSTAETATPAHKDAAQVSRTEVAAARSCPRCDARIASEQQKFCTRCELALWCENPGCPRPLLDDPLGRVCGECRTRIPTSPPWSYPQEEALGAPATAAAAFPAASAARSGEATVVNIRSRLAGETER